MRIMTKLEFTAMLLRRTTVPPEAEPADDPSVMWIKNGQVTQHVDVGKDELLKNPPTYAVAVRANASNTGR